MVENLNWCGKLGLVAPAGEDRMACLMLLLWVEVVLVLSVGLGEMVAALKLCMRGGMGVFVRRVCLVVVGAGVLVGVSGGLTMRLVMKAGILVPGDSVCLGVEVVRVVLGVRVELEVDGEALE